MKITEQLQIDNAYMQKICDLTGLSQEAISTLVAYKAIINNENNKSYSREYGIFPREARQTLRVIDKLLLCDAFFNVVEHINIYFQSIEKVDELYNEFDKINQALEKLKANKLGVAFVDFDDPSWFQQNLTDKLEQQNSGDDDFADMLALQEKMVDKIFAVVKERDVNLYHAQRCLITCIEEIGEQEGKNNGKH